MVYKSDYDNGRSPLSIGATSGTLYTSMTSPLPVYPVVAAHGCELTLADGGQLVDGMSSWWAAIHGYNHPRLNAAMKAQIGPDVARHVRWDYPPLPRSPCAASWWR
ncbi:adenosylmethionine-8-amino-7-oxononanoate aminotransferase [Klebsiella michiganensis]|uniref:Adenosylmethionine-8-amino-7-oxononanoate aminotransferase n=1 Tax=Klebsiella michiganensis TaxID=1134687 RepID=A0A7H4N3H6_9ENTR|nr:adenosylmethionine-8-amino-7-oxononanoate aminotransferase [Klebsiella michiganensis]